MKKYKLIFTVPITHAEVCRKAIGEAGAGSLGNYEFCSFSSRGIGRFKPKAGAHPTIGTVGKMEEVEEEKIECRCEEANIKQIIAALKQVHPYEEIAYDVLALEDF